jgi:hypothetical protein
VGGTTPSADLQDFLLRSSRERLKEGLEPAV